MRAPCRAAMPALRCRARRVRRHCVSDRGADVSADTGRVRVGGRADMCADMRARRVRVRVCRHACRPMDRQVCRNVYEHMGNDTCMDWCTDMLQVETCVAKSREIHMSTDICVDLCIHLRVQACIDICTRRKGNIYAKT